MYINIYVYKYIFIYIHIYISIYLYIYIHMYAVSSYQSLPISPERVNKTWEFQRICTGLFVRQDQLLGEHQRRTAWRAKHSKDRGDGGWEKKEKTQRFFGTWPKKIPARAGWLKSLWLGGARRRSALARSCRAPTGADQSNAGTRRGVFKEGPPLLSAKLWFDPVGLRQLRAKALRRRASPGDSVGRFRRYRCSTLLTIIAIFLCVELSYTDCSLIWIMADYCRPQKRRMIWIWVQLLQEFLHFESQHRFFVPKNCTILVCFHPLLRTCIWYKLAYIVQNRDTRQLSLADPIFEKGPQRKCRYCTSSNLKLENSALELSYVTAWPYGVATISRLLIIISLFCKRAL